jgi:hypothetical protein
MQKKDGFCKIKNVFTREKERKQERFKRSCFQLLVFFWWGSIRRRIPPNTNCLAHFSFV